MEVNGCVAAIGHKHRLLEDERVWAVMDDLKLPLQQSGDWMFSTIDGRATPLLWMDRFDVALSTAHDSITQAEHGIHLKLGCLHLQTDGNVDCKTKTS